MWAEDASTGDATALLLEMRVAEGDPVRCSTGAWVRPGPPAAVPRPRRLPRSGPGVRQHRPHDVGLIHLAGDGVFPEVPATPIYAHDEGLDIQEWRGSRRFVHHTGYGLGTPPTVPATCGERGTTSGTKRPGREPARRPAVAHPRGHPIGRLQRPRDRRALQGRLILLVLGLALAWGLLLLGQTLFNEPPPDHLVCTGKEAQDQAPPNECG
jgi:hypothetical protein